MAFSTGGAKGLSSEINVTPLIDVLLVLLIIFMVIVPLAPLGLKTTIPAPRSPSMPAELAETPVLVELNGDVNHPAYRIDGAVVESGAVEARLRELLARRSERQVLVRADAGLDFGAVSSVVDAGRVAGADTVGLITPGAAR